MSTQFNSSDSYLLEESSRLSSSPPANPCHVAVQIQSSQVESSVGRRQVSRQIFAIINTTTNNNKQHKNKSITEAAALFSTTEYYHHHWRSTDNMMLTSPHPSAIAAAFISTGIISLAPNVLLFLFPNYGASGGSDSGRSILSLGQALAVGGLLGDVFIHTLPDCFADSLHGEKEDIHNHSNTDIGLRVILGFSLFLILDIFVRSIEDAGGHSNGCHSRRSEEAHTTCDGRHDENDNKQPWHRIQSSVVLLNLLGDSLHNFTDGLAIGASFSITQLPTKNLPTSFISIASSAFILIKSKGGLASVSVFLHEIPHELGDFATLIKAGFTRNMAIGAQFLTAIAAFIGTAFGLFSGQIIQGLGHEVLIPFTAGGEGISMIFILLLPFWSYSLCCPPSKGSCTLHVLRSYQMY